MPTPYDLLTQTEVPASVQIWALGQIPDGTLSLIDVQDLQTPGVAAGQVEWSPPDQKIAGVLTVRPYRVRFGPLDAGLSEVGVWALAIVDTSGDGELLSLSNMNGPFMIPAYPGQLELSCVAILVRGDS